MAQTVVPGDTTKQQLATTDTTRTDTGKLAAVAPPSDSLVAATKRQQLLDSLEKNADMKSEILYNAQDSIVYDPESGFLHLYGKAEVNYKAEDISLKAERISLNINDRTVHAFGLKDTLGSLRGTPVFLQGGQQYLAREMYYNFNSGKARIMGGRTQQGENFILSDTVKRLRDGTIFGLHGKFTTCNAEHPHFYVESSKMKLVNKQIISGPLRMVIGGFPLPVIVPFGFFPNKQGGRQTGLIFPKFRYAQQRGYALEGIGYYFAINDHIDLAVNGDIFMNGSFGIGVNTGYKWMYRADGNMALKFTYNYFGERDDPEFKPQRGFSINWNHRQPINPTTKLNASVSLASTSYMRGYSLNTNDYLTNQQRSSIALNKTFPNSPFSLNASASLSQDISKQTISGTLPDVSFQMNRIQPMRALQSKKGLSVLGNLGLSYSMRTQNTLSSVPDSMFMQAILSPRDSIAFRSISGKDTTYSYKTGFELAQNGMVHNIPISTQIKLGKYINIPLSANYNEYWYFKYIDKYYDPEISKTQAVSRILPGFRTARDFNIGASMSTNLYGIYQLTRTKRQITFRQRMSPSIGYTFKPDFGILALGGATNFGIVQADSTGRTETYSRLTTGIGGYPTLGETQSISFGLGNTFEMKFRKKESFKEDFDEKQDKFQRLTLMNLTLNTSYNLAADSFKLAPLSINANTNILNNKVGIFARGSINPYHVNDAGRALNIYTWQALPQNVVHGKPYSSFGRLTTFSAGLNTSFRPDKNKKKNVLTRGVDSVEAAFALANPDLYVDFDIPWSVNFGFNFNYNKPGINPATFSAVTNINGDVSFTKNWKVTYSTGYDFIAKKATLSNFGIMRDLHCWTMAFTWTPFGTLTNYMVVVNVKNPTLQALRLRKQESWQDRRRF